MKRQRRLGPMPIEKHYGKGLTAAIQAHNDRLAAVYAELDKATARLTEIERLRLSGAIATVEAGVTMQDEARRLQAIVAAVPSVLHAVYNDRLEFRNPITAAHRAEAEARQKSADARKKKLERKLGDLLGPQTLVDALRNDAEHSAHFTAARRWRVAAIASGPIPSPNDREWFDEFARTYLHDASGRRFRSQ